jgi:hypothetical protein
MKPERLKHSLRRHHSERKKVGVRKTLSHYFMFGTDLPPRRVGMYARTPKVCSCFMCGNPRHYHGGPTLQERRAVLDTPFLETESPYFLPKSAQSHFG